MHYLRERGIDNRDMGGDEIDQLAQDIAVVIAKKLPSQGLFASRLSIGIEQLMPRLGRYAHNVKRLCADRPEETAEKSSETSIEMESVG